MQNLRKLFHALGSKLIATICIIVIVIVVWVVVVRENRLSLRDYNVLWITAESMKPEHLGTFGYNLPTSPNIDAFAKTGTKFDLCINPSAWTSENMVSNFTSLYSPIHGVETREKHVKEAWHLPLEKLSELGYEIPYTQSFQQDTNFKNLGFKGGFGKQEPEEWLEELKSSKFFLWIHLLQTHLPYDPPEKHKNLFFNDSLIPNSDSRKRVEAVRSQVVIPRGTVQFNKEEDLPAISALYDADVHSMDERFGEIIAKVESLGLREKTIIIFSADHGEEQLEHGFIGHASTARGGSMFDEIIRVPLIISLPGSIPQNYRVKSQVRGVDIIPTIFELLNIPLEERYSGKSLMSLFQARGETEDRVGYSASSYAGYQEPDPNNIKNRMYSVRTREWKLVRYVFNPKPIQYLLFNLKEDPKELYDVKGKFPEILEGMIKIMDQWLNDSNELSTVLDSKAEDVKNNLGMSGDSAGDLGAIEILYPSENAEISFASSGGIIALAWKGDAQTEYLVDLEIGIGDQQIKTSLTVRGPELKRTFSESYWSEYVRRYGHVKFRVKVNSVGAAWSDWRSVKLL